MQYAIEMAGGDSVASSLVATAARIVNVIPWVCRSEAGIKTICDLPAVAAAPVR